MSLILSLKPISSAHKRIQPISSKIPARDRVLDFGKYKGKMLGTLPSKYLKWVSNNLRARDFEEWAKLADEVLQDPVYKDRLEWELAQKVLNGDDSRASRTETPVSDLLEISERFGWDNDNKAAWNRIDFGLLGSSKGGRIPRKGNGKSEFLNETTELSEMGELGSGEKKLSLRKERNLGVLRRGSRVSELEEKVTSFEKNLERKTGREPGFSGIDSVVPPVGKMSSLEGGFTYQRVGKVESFGKESRASESKSMDLFEGRKVGFLSDGTRYYETKEEDFGEESISGRREERREKQRLKRTLQMQRLRKEVGVKEQGVNISGMQRQIQKGIFNPFPGREALLRKVRKPED